MKLPLKNSKHRIQTKAVTSKGFGVGDIDGFTVFTDGLLTGDIALVQIIKVKKRYGYGKIMQIVTPSGFRIKSPCPVSKRCGGCQWQHCSYEAQLEFKRQFVYDAIERIGGIKNPPVADVEKMDFDPGSLRYRNKAVFPIVPHKNKDGFAIGMFAPRSHHIIEVTDCLIQHEAHIRILEALKKHMREKKISAYDETAHKGLMRFVMVRNSLKSGEVMVVFAINGAKIPGEEKLISEMQDLGASTVLININKERGNIILGSEFRLLSGSGHLTEAIGGVDYRISASSFFQVNTKQAEKLYMTAIRQAALSDCMTVVDAHSGAGGVLLRAAMHVKKAIGIDSSRQAISDATENAKLAGITNAEFICQTAEEALPELLKEFTPDVIFLDPPRKGCEPELLSSIIGAEIPKIVYISCDPATLARDIKIFSEGGYRLLEAIPVDMFPFTGKIETSCLLERVVVY